MMFDWPDVLVAMGCEWHLVGSRATSSVVRLDSDWDYLVHLPDEALTNCLTGSLCALGFEREGGLHYPVIANGSWQSLRRDEVNLIVTGSQDFVRMHATATGLCRFLDVTDKAMRKEIFQQVFGEPHRWPHGYTKWEISVAQGYALPGTRLDLAAFMGPGNDLGVPFLIGACREQ